MFRLLCLIIFFSFSEITAATSEIIGQPFNFCDTSSKKIHEDYYVEFMDDGVEMEAEVYLTPTDKPCGGEMLLTIGRVWNYEINPKEIFSYLVKVVVFISDPKLISFFNESRFCDVSNWKVDTIVECTGKNIFGYESLAGHRTIHQFRVSGHELHVSDEYGGKLILKKYRSPKVPHR